MDPDKARKYSSISHKEWQKVVGKFCNTDPVPMINKEHCKEDLLDIKKVLDDAEIDFWLVFGTCLGAVRNKDFLDFDDNINIAVYEEDLLPKMDMVKEKFISLGFIFRQIPKKRGTKLNLHRHKHKNGIEGLFLDPSFKKNRYRLSNAFKHPRKYFETYGEIEFQGETFRVPSPVEKYLSFLYTDWKTPIALKDLSRPELWRNKKSNRKR